MTVQAIFLGNKHLGEPMFASTCCTRLDVTEAIEKAVIELLYVVMGLKDAPHAGIIYGSNFDNSVWEFSDRANLYSAFPSKKAYGFLFPPKAPVINFADIPHSVEQDPRKNLERLVADFRRHKLRLYFRNNSPSSLTRAGFWVYRAFSPDLILIDGVHRYRHLGPRRYFELPQVLGLQNKPKKVTDLNEWPHPLP